MNMISVEKYNEVMDMLKEREEEILMYQNQIINAQSSLMELIQTNFDLKEEIQALKKENESIISELETKNKEIEELLPAATLGGKALNLFEDFTKELEMRKYKQMQIQQEVGGMNV